jgi:hypothetical protein
MKKRLIPVLIIMAMAAAIALGLWLGIRALKPGKYKENLEKRLEARLNADVQLGVIAPIIYPGLGIQLKDVKLNNKGEQGEPGRELFYAKSIKLIISKELLWDERKLFIKEIFIHNPRIKLHRDKKAGLDLKNIVKKRPLPEPEQELESKEKGRLGTWIAEKLRRYVPKSGGIEEFIFHLERVVILNADLNIQDDKKPNPFLLEPMTLSGVDMTIENLEQENRVKFLLNTVFPQNTRGTHHQGGLLEIKGKAEIEYHNKKVSLKSINGRWANNIIKSAYLIISNNNSKLQASSKVKLDADLHEVRSLLLSLPIRRLDQIKPMDFSGRGMIEIALNWRSPDKVCGLSYEIDSVLFDAGFDPGMVVAPITDFNGSAAVKDRNVRIHWSDLMVGQQPVRASFTYQKDDVSIFTVNMKGQGVDLGKVFHSSSEKPANSKESRAFKKSSSRWQGMAALNDARYQDIKIQRLHAEWNYVNQSLFFNKLHARMCQGRFVDTQSWVNFESSDHVLCLIQGKIRDMKLAQLFEDVFRMKFFIDGNLSWDGYVVGTVRDGKLQMNSLCGDFKVKVKDGEFIGYSLGARLLGFLGIPIDQEKHGKYFEKLNADMIIVDGVIYFDDIVVRSWNLEAHAAGSVDLTNQELNIWVAVYPLEILSTWTKPIPIIGALINTTQEALFGYYAHVQGSWTKPEMRSYMPLTEKIPPPPRPKPKPEPPEELKMGKTAIPVEYEMIEAEEKERWLDIK